DDVFVIGTADQEQLKMVGDAASEALQQALAMIPASRQKLDAGKAQLRGRVSIVVFPKRSDYGDNTKKDEGRDVPANWNAHWRYNGVDAYISMVVGDNETTAELMPRLVAPMASLAIAMRGDSPRWFREGMGRAIAAKTVARELDGVQQWDAAI